MNVFLLKTSLKLHFVLNIMAKFTFYRILTLGSRESAYSTKFVLGNVSQKISNFKNRRKSPHSKLVLHQACLLSRLSSIIGCFLSKLFFYHRMLCVKGHLLSKVSYISSNFKILYVFQQPTE